MKPSLVFSPFSRARAASAARVAKVVGDRLLAEDVLAGLDRRGRQLEMRMARRAHVDDVDVVAADEIEVAGGDLGNVEAPRRLFSEMALRIGNGDDATARVAAVARQMRAERPRAGAEHADAKRTSGSHRPSS